MHQFQHARLEFGSWLAGSIRCRHPISWLPVQPEPEVTDVLGYLLVWVSHMTLCAFDGDVTSN